MSTDHQTKQRIVILGGYGVFGGKLAIALLRHPRFDVVVAGRSLDKANAFCAERGGTPIALDRTETGFEQSLADLNPFVTVDAAGPFHAYGNRSIAIAEAALKAGSHYLDLSDDAGFTGKIDALDETARQAGLTALSGTSTVPALSSAAVEALKTDFSRLDLIESTILPGNRAPRGLSVMRAVLAQVGNPLTVFRDGRWETVPAWSGLSRRHLNLATKGDLPPRWSSFIGAPDLALFSKHYGTATNLFRAGLELPVMHLGLWCLSWLVRLKMLRSLEPAAKILQRIAGWLEPFGSDRGGMEVRVCGLDESGLPLQRRWTLIAEAGDGPHIPAVAAAILCEKLAVGTVEPGARPCLGEVSVEDIDRATQHLNVSSGSSTDRPATLFQEALGPQFNNLAEPIRSLHTVFDRRRWSGKAKVSRSASLVGNLVCKCIGFPPAAEDTPVTVTIERANGTEVWRRQFGPSDFKSVLSPGRNAGNGHVRERFGVMSFDLHLRLEKDRLMFPVHGATVFGFPIPKWLLPISNSSEFVEGGRYHFDVKVSLPVIGDLVHYRGWLEPEARQTRE